MTKKHLPIVQSAFFISLLVSSIAVSTAQAVDIDFFQGNDIIFYDPSGKANTCTPETASKGSSAVTTSSNNNEDYAGNQIISDEHMEKIKKYQPIYEQASKETRIPWQMFAVLHLRESVLAYYNPGNGQGIYQDSTQRFNDYKEYDPDFEMNDSEFLRQTKNAGQEIIEKVEASGHSMDEIEKGDEAAIKNAFFYYNGAAGLYVDQAIAVVGPDAPGYEGSPYVMNRADKERDPTVEPTKNNNTWGQVKVDYAPYLSYPANSDHGAYIMYAALAGIPTSGGAAHCAGKSFGASANGWAVDAMQIFYQIKEPWSSKNYGALGSINDCGCGPTSISMAVATLAELSEDEMNPKIMADRMSGSDGQIGVADNNSNCGSYLPGPSRTYVQQLSTDFNLTFEELGLDYDKVREAIKRGSFVVASGQSPLGGHVFLIRGITDDGKFLVADPASEANTNNESGLSLDIIPKEMDSEAEKQQFAKNAGGLAVSNGFFEVRKS